jgi:hypothetical protein
MPAGWFDLGWIKDYAITPQSKVGSIASGYRGATRAKVRGQVGEEFEFKFQEFSRMALKISTGCEAFNFLAAGQASTTSPLGTSGTAAVSLGASGYQATGGTATDPRVAGLPTVFLPAGSGALFIAFNQIVVDIDYDKVSVGFVGSNGIPVYVNNAPQDVDFIRRTSDFTGTVALVVAGPIAGVAGGQDALVLVQPFTGGGASSSVNPGPVVPPAGSKIQKITGWTVREGGTFIQDWSGLFVLDTIDGDQICFYYPHISITQFKNINTRAIDNVGTTDETRYELDATFESLAFDDPLDGETVVCYRAFYPSSGTGVPI